MQECWETMVEGYLTEDTLLSLRNHLASSSPADYRCILHYSKLGMTAQVSLFLLDILWYTGVSLYQIPPSCPDRILAF